MRDDLAVSDGDRAIRRGHAGRATNDGRAEWLVSSVLADGAPFEVVYDHPHGGDFGAVRVVSVWRLDIELIGGATL